MVGFHYCCISDPVSCDELHPSKESGVTKALIKDLPNAIRGFLHLEVVAYAILKDYVGRFQQADRLHVVRRSGFWWSVPSCFIIFILL